MFYVHLFLKAMYRKEINFAFPKSAYTYICLYSVEAAEPLHYKTG